jgi:hypothetical protein
MQAPSSVQNAPNRTNQAGSPLAAAPPSAPVPVTREPSGVQASTLLYVPAYPHTEGGRQDIAFELRTSAAGDVVAVAFTSKTKLVDSLGHFQPWVAVSPEKFRTFIGTIGVRVVIVDPQIDASLRRIDVQQLRQFVERS